MHPLVSIIIPVYNCEKYIKQAVSSALLQTYKDKEIIIVDDGSSDETYHMVDKFSKHLEVIHKKNGGTASALNRGIKHSKGTFIKWLSADDVLFNNAVEILVREALKTEDYENKIFYSDYNYINSAGMVTGDFIEKNMNDCSQEERNKALWRYFYGNGSTSLIHKSIFDRFGLFDESLNASEDYEAWLRFCLVYGVKMHCISQKTLYYRQHSEQLTHKFGAVNDPKIRKKILSMMKEDKRLIFG